MALRESLERQSALYARLEALSDAQGALLEPESADALLRVLAERDGIIAELVATHDASKPLMRRWERERSSVADGDRVAVRAMLDGIEARMALIAARDAAHFATLRANRDRVGRELSGANAARAAVSAYGRGRAADTGARYQDREG